MQLGRRLHELWRLRLGLAVAALLALYAAASSVGSVGLLPPSFEPHKLEMAGASTRVLVDTPKSSVLDLEVNLSDFEGIKDRALLVGNVMASAPVRQYIGRRAGVPASWLQVASPVTPDWPRPLANSESKKSTSDLLKSPDAYRLSIQANPTVPILELYAEAPTAEAAEHLANGAVAGMEDYLKDLGATQEVAASEQVHLEQLGTAKGEVLNKGVSVKVAILAFLLTFAVASATVLFLARTRQGWQMEARRERAVAAAHSADTAI
jgi:hypothetical protein